MTFETFFGILQDEGMTDEAIKVIWDARPLNIELQEDGLRDCAKQVRKFYPRYFKESDCEAPRYIPSA